MPRKYFAIRKSILLLATIQVLSLGTSPAQAVTISWSRVGNAGNAADPATDSLYGAVKYNYNIGTYDVTTGQYTAFLNAVAVTDTYGLWNSLMSTDLPTVGILRSGSSGTYSYSVIGNPNVPVFNATWGDAVRFANWLQNGQPNAPEESGTTETGGYTLNGATSRAALMAVRRNSNATIFLPNENEWYKAAYYDPANGTYWRYPTQSNSLPSNALSATGTNNANYFNSGYTDPINHLTSVGAFADSLGPYGTYDIGGDVWQWFETAVDSGSRGIRGGAFNSNSSTLFSFGRGSFDPTGEVDGTIGFRVASLPEPGSITLMLAGAAGLLIWRKRPNA